MSYSHCERLSALDAMFLGLEDEHISMHVGAVGVFSHGTLANEKGQVDFEKLHNFVHVALDDVPRFRQKLAFAPLLGHPVWIDDAKFNLGYHLRHSALPAPGTVRQLKRMVGRVMSQKLDRGKPLWEMAVVDGLEGGRFAVLFKAHHCMVDGIAGIDLIASLLRLEPSEAPASRHQWVARPAPGSLRMLRDEIAHRAAEPIALLAAAPQAILHPRDSIAQVGANARDVIEVLTANLEPAVATPMNDDIGQHRRCDWTSMPLDEIKRIGKSRGGTINDVVLTIVAGAVGRFLRTRNVATDADTIFRAMVPVSTRLPAERGRPGNRVVNYAAPLPVHELAPETRLDLVIKTMAGLKASRMARGTELFEELSDVTFTGMMVELAKIATNLRAYNMVVTNVPGPPMPLYMLGARLDEIFPVVPLFANQALNIGLFSYCGRLSWGFTADWDKVHDLHDFVGYVEDEFRHLAAIAAPPARRPSQRRRSAGARATR